MTIFVRLLPYDDKAAALAVAVDTLRSGDANLNIHTVDPASFRQIPGSPFAYWVSEHIRQLFAELEPFELGERSAKIGASTKDDFRWLRAWWEVASSHILDAQNGPQDETRAYQAWCRERTRAGKRWVIFAKGGEWSPFYAPLSLVIDWLDDGAEIKRTVSEYRAQRGWSPHWKAELHNPEYYFRPGLTWPRRTNGLSFRALPAGCIFADKGPAAFVPRDKHSTLLALPAIMNSRAFYAFVRLMVGRESLAQSFEVGLIQSVPMPSRSPDDSQYLAALSSSCVDLKRRLDHTNETSHLFHLPALLQLTGETLAAQLGAWHKQVVETQQQLATHQRQIDDIAFRLYGIEGEDRQAIEESPGGGRQVVGAYSDTTTAEDDEEVDADDETESSMDARKLVADLLSYAAGCAFGRWDVRLATGERTAPPLPDPFAPLPVCSPGMLTGADVLPLCEAPPGYPLRLGRDGILPGVQRPFEAGAGGA